MQTSLAKTEAVRQELRRFTSAKLVARNSVLNLGSEVWALLVLIVAMPVVIGRLGKDAFGLFSLAWVVLGYMVILDIGVSRAATKFISEHLAKREHSSAEEVSRTTLTANLLLGAFGGLALLVCAPALTDRVFRIPVELRHDAVIAFYGLAVAVPAILVQAALRAVLSSYQRFGWMSLVNSGTITAQWGLACLLSVVGFRVGTIVLVAVFVRTAATFVYVAVLRSIDRKLVGFSANRFGEIGRLLRYGGWVSISQLMTPLLVYLDRILIASLISLGTMAVYVIPYEVVMRLRVIPGSLVVTLFPSFSERSGMEHDARLSIIYSSALRYLMLLLTPGFLLLAVLSRDVLSLWVGAEYARQGAIVLKIMAAGALLNSLAYVPYAALQALGRPDIPAKLHVAEVPIYVGLSLLLISQFGVAGAAVAVTARLGADAVMLFWAADKYVCCRLQYQDLSRTLVLNAVFVVVIGCIRYFFPSSISRLAAAVIAALIYYLASWFFALDPRDKPVLLRALHLMNEAAS